MESMQESLLSRLGQEFEPTTLTSRAAPHECPECDGISQYLKQRTWSDVMFDFVQQNEDVLPLLSEEAYHAYLPAWLRVALHEPERGVASQLLVNLESTPPTHLFSDSQAQLIREIVGFVTDNNGWGENDPVNLGSIANTQRVWARSKQSD